MNIAAVRHQAAPQVQNGENDSIGLVSPARGKYRSSAKRHDRESLHGNDLDAQPPSEQLEIFAVRSDDRGAVPSGRQRDQDVILEIAALVAIPIVSIADHSNDAAGIPPVIVIWRPGVPGERVEPRDESLRGACPRTAPQLGEHDGRMTDDECSTNLFERLVVQAAFPIADVHAGIDNRPHGSRRLDAARCEPRAAPVHEPPEFLHFDNTLDREADGLRVGVDAEHATRALDRPLVDKIGPAGISTGAPF